MTSLNLTFDNISNADLLVGDASVVGDWNTFFDLPTYGTPFSAVTISGNTVQLFGGSDIIIKESLFDDPGGYGTHLLQVNDSAASVIEIRYDAFGNDNNSGCPNLTTVNFPGVTNITGDYSFISCTSLTTINFPELVVIGNRIYDPLNPDGFSCFANCTSLSTINLPKLEVVSSYCFDNCSSLTTINLPSCTDLGGTVGNENVFLNINGNTITLTVPPELMTCDSGSPDGDIQYLQANNTVTVVEVTPTPSPTPTPTPSPTGSIVITPTPTPTKTSTPTPSITPTNTPSPTFIPYTGVPVNEFYAYDINILGNFSGGTAPSGSTAPHPIMIGNDGIPYAQMNAIQIGGFGGLNN